MSSIRDLMTGEMLQPLSWKDLGLEQSYITHIFRETFQSLSKQIPMANGHHIHTEPIIRMVTVKTL